MNGGEERAAVRGAAGQPAAAGTTGAARGVNGGAPERLQVPAARPAPGAPAEAAEANAYAFLVHQANSPSVRLRVAADCSLIAADSDARPFNTVFAPAFSPDSLAERVREVTRVHTSQGRTPVWWIGPSAAPAGLSDRLVALGLAPMAPVMLMSAALSPGRRADPADGRGGAAREVREVRSRDELAEFVGVHRAAYGAPAAHAAFTFRVLASLPLGGDAPLRHVLVRAGGTPVAVASVFLHAGVAGLYNVATVPGARGLGHGTAATLAALDEAAGRGATTATLGAEAGAERMYAPLGFAPCGTLARVSYAPLGLPGATRRESAANHTGTAPSAG